VVMAHHHRLSGLRLRCKQCAAMRPVRCACGYGTLTQAPPVLGIAPVDVELGKEALPALSH
jgi:hypothetical protein